MTTIESGSATFDLGRVIQRTFSVIGKNFVPFTLAAVVLAGIPSFLGALGNVGGDGNIFLLQPWQWALVSVAFVMSIVGAYILQAAIVHSTVQTLNGRTANLRSALEMGVRYLLPLLGLAIIVLVSITIGTVLLIVPGLIIAVLWSVAAPALVVEKRTVLSALQRSRDLTRGHRWSIFGLIVIYVIVYSIIANGIGAIGLALSGGFNPDAAQRMLSFNLVLSPLISITQAIIGSAGVAAIYYELRTAKEGVGAEQLASVFD